MNKLLTVFAALALGTIVASTASADQVLTTTGDTVEGTIKSVTAGVMTVSSPGLGDVSVPLGHVQTFSTEKPIVIQLPDGTQINSQVASSTAGNITLQRGDGLTPEQLSVSAIDAINPKAFSMSIAVGAILTRGNTFTDSINAGLKMEYVVGREDFSIAGEYLYGRQKTRDTSVAPVRTTTTTTTDRWEVDGKYQHFFSKKFYGYADVDVTKDRIALLDIRVVPSVGVGYDLLNKSPLKLSVEGGAAYMYQQYSNSTPTQSAIALKLAYHLTYDFNPRIQLFNDVIYYPTLAHISSGIFLINADIGVHAKLTQKLFGELKVEWDYNSNPANNALKNDERYIASLGYAI